MLLREGAFDSTEVEFFNREGYIVAENVFEPSDLEPLRAALTDAIDNKIEELRQAGRLTETYADLPFEKRLTRIYRDDADNGETVMRYLEGLRGGGFKGRSMYDLITHPKLLRAVSGLVGPEIVASSVYRIRPKVPGVGRGVIPWHQDSGYFSPHCDRHLILTCWIPLVDATVENGCMEILPKSHTSGIIKHHTGGNGGLLVITDDDLPADTPDKMVAEAPLGGVVFMTNLTAHCSTPNLSDTIRWSVDLRFQSADVPNNTSLWPGEQPGHADENLRIACYAPEADFLVKSESNPVVDYARFIERRSFYDSLEGMSGPKRWQPVGEK
jgi:ectoine hydroxylase-related dioxygenase (phytanoyl-CoA dioxygenase family)